MDLDTNTIKLQDWLAVTQCLRGIFTYKAVPTVKAVAGKVQAQDLY